MPRCCIGPPISLIASSSWIAADSKALKVSCIGGFNSVVRTYFADSIGQLDSKAVKVVRS